MKVKRADYRYGSVMQILAGEVFLCEGNKELLMRIQVVQLSTGTQMNAVELRTGVLTWVDEDFPVHVVHGMFIEDERR